MASGDTLVTSQVVKEVPAGTTAVLDCASNDYNHNFMFWVLNNTTKIIGPGNEHDERKYKYEVLSGKLQIDVSMIKHTMQKHCFLKPQAQENKISQTHLLHIDRSIYNFFMYSSLLLQAKKNTI